ncbi:GlsB/YeaQ/YmgE family stress response membrane protein [Mycobacterium tuberculosis]|uniref:GlsB/YeaQ/YmgE family stress response membrane protein n=1 Tax=Mycobacterium tuberculosis TaxID=1773 RepID=UPI0004595726|nr:GlsB/YeaQ/YmgE family stress response membrane protein [Mycobacterium tuberculosis]KAO65163.1 transmembrane protein [Mycobacterium tuberculosis MD19591]KAP20379.1 transmembrane protein [Mycobacterium tuberculosis MD18314]CFH75873.1 transmembrane protein [Mycobacterium tuberculosis]CLU43102.1 transmembrane protein [Mycobacterium tuberculosis]CMA60851.1 transmembrane protein [Mycobacterium tuberculosis]
MDITATTEFSAMNLDGKTGIGWLGYIVIGGIAGWLASKIVKGGGSGILMNVVIGVVGAFGAGLVLNALGVDVNHGGYGFTFFVALGGAVVLLWIVGMVRKT